MDRFQTHAAQAGNGDAVMKQLLSLLTVDDRLNWHYLRICLAYRLHFQIIVEEYPRANVPKARKAAAAAELRGISQVAC